MTDTTPPIHIKTDDGDLHICFSRGMKVGIGVATVCITSLLIGAFGFAWQSNGKLNSIERHLQDIDRQISATNSRVERLDDKIDRKADK